MILSVLFFIICAIRIESLLIACLIIYPYFIINFLSDLNYKKILSNFIFALSTIKFPLIFSILGFLINIILNKLFFNSYIPQYGNCKKNRI